MSPRKPPEAPIAPSNYLSPAEFAAAHGLSLTTVRRYLKLGMLPMVQPGGPRHRVLVRVDALKTSFAANVPGQPRAERGAAEPTINPTPNQISKPKGPKPRWLKP